MKKFDLTEDRIESFIQSVHGITIGNGSKAVVNCISCYGFHDIRPTDDPLCKVNSEILARICGRENCNPGISDKIADYKIQTNRNQKKSRTSDHVKEIFIWIMFIGWLFILFVVAVLTIIGFFLGPLKEIISLKNKFTKNKKKQK
jgi:hypothetical protein